MKSAVIYARYSSERQTEQSIEGQLRICNEFAKQNDLEIVDTYIDRAMTGTNDNRPAFQKMLKDAEISGLWQIVLVYAIDRFGRNSIEVAVNKQKLKKNKKTLISATQRTSENIDGSKNLDGIILENMYIGLAEYYSAELSQKIKRGLHESRQKGFCGGGRPPYGYFYKDRRVCIDEERADVIRFIFKEYYSGKVVREIIDELTEKGVLYHGKRFIENTIFKILHNEKYIGIARYDDGVYNNIFPALIDKNTFDGVQTILSQNKIGSRNPNSVYLLKNKIICGCCGNRYQGDCGTNPRGNTFYYYSCMCRKKLHICTSEQLKKEVFENMITGIIFKILKNDEKVDAIAEKLTEICNGKAKENSAAELLKKDKTELQKSIDNVMKAIEQGIITESTKARLQDLETKKHSLEEKILLAEYSEQQKITKQEIYDYLKTTLKKEPRFLLNLLVNKIIVYKDKIEIFFNFTNRTPPTPPIPPRRYARFIETNDIPPADSEKTAGVLNNFFRLLFLRSAVFFQIFLFFRIFLLLLSVVFFFFRKLPDHLIRADRRKSARSAEHNGNNDIIRRNDFGQSKITNNAADNAAPRCNQGNKPLEFFVFPHGMLDDIDHPIHDRRYCGNAD